MNRSVPIFASGDTLDCVRCTHSARFFRSRPLAVCLSAALATQMAVASAIAPGAAKRIPTSTTTPSIPAHALAHTWTVKNCNDSGTDSLRDIVENPMKAQSGDTVDLSQLPTLCGMTQSVITLGSEIKVAEDDLTLQGPSQGMVTISAAGMSRVFHHTGTGALALNALTVSDGYYHTAAGAYGGCIESDNGDVLLNHIVVSHCTVLSDNGWGNG